MSKILSIALVSFLLTGCGYLTKELPTVAAPRIPENAKAKCPDLEPLAEGSNMGDLHRFAMDAVDNRNECAARHDALVDIVNERGL